MNKLALILLLLFLYGCPSSGGSSPTSPTTGNAPVISNLRFTPASTTLNAGGGSISVNLDVDYNDQDGDIASYTYTIIKTDNNGKQVGVTEAGTTNATTKMEGKVSGTTTLMSGGVDTSYIHQTTATIFFTDKGGNKSNTLSASVNVI